MMSGPKSGKPGFGNTAILTGGMFPRRADAMTSDGIDDDDWERIRELAVEVVNASADGDAGVERMRLFEGLDRLEQIYGRLPSIVATRGDFAETPAEGVELLGEAFRLATERGDVVNELHIADSLARAYVEELSDRDRGRQWRDVLAGRLRLAGGETDIAEYEALEATWARLPPK